MSLEDWYYVAGIVTGAASVLGLTGLTWYAIETRKIRKAAEEQLETTHRPCVLLAENADQSLGFDGMPLVFESVGAGPALNLRWRLFEKAAEVASDWVEGPSLAPNSNEQSRLYIKHLVGARVECNFVSLSGTRYQTTAQFSENTQDLDVRHSFKKLDSEKE